ncbi:MAG TPA: hypothetical protein PLQ89_19500 [Phycisphaerae bacterium]|nr:hypothetical protein [Phycisphaerae bacterium]
MRYPQATRASILVAVATVGLGGTTLAGAQTEPGSSPLNIAGNRQLFIDRTFIENARGIELRVHQPVKTGELTIKPDHPWEQGGIGPYSSVLWEPGKPGEPGAYHMWYHAMTTTQWHTGDDRGAICYARSRDGIHWEKPALDLVPFEGSSGNNIVLGHGAAGAKLGQDGGMVFIDPTAPPDQKFRMAIRVKEFGEGLHVFSSPDGIRWRCTHPSVITARPEQGNHHLDSQNVLFWDAGLGKYVAYVRRNVKDAGSQGRSIARGESATLDGFPVVQDMPVAFGPDRDDLFHHDVPAVDYYMSAAIRYPWADRAYFMFPTAYYHYLGGILPEFKGEVPTNAGPLHTQFAASRDGIRWERFGREPFVPLGMKGEFDWASARVFYGMVPDVSGRYLYMYYRASDWLHGWDRDERNKRLLTAAGLGASENIAVISRVVLRRDGFVSVRAAYTGGEFATPPLVFTGRQLVLNIDTSATGIARVEIQDANGAPLPGYGLDDCDLIHTTNEINRVVSWQGRRDVTGLAGRPIRLRFSLRDADLYAMQFTD